MAAQDLSGRLTLAPVGSLDATALLESLHQALSQDGGHAQLQVDLSRAQGLDNLAVSALLVLLRRHCGQYQTILLTGLESWVIWRLSRSGAEEILGRGWSAAFQRGQAQFCCPTAEGNQACPPTP